VLLCALTLLAFFLPPAKPAASEDAVFAPLWAYTGTWQVSKKSQAAGGKPYQLANSCAQVGQFFSCQQVTDGSVSALLVIVPTRTPGHFYTQSILPDARATRRGDLYIEGDKWTFASNWNQGGKTIYYRTVNTFAGKTRIHFEQQESTDNKEWKVVDSGDQLRTVPGKATVAR